MQKIRVKHHGYGLLWLVGWLFTIGFLDLTFWRGVLAFIIWPVYIGDALRPLLKVISSF